MLSLGKTMLPNDLGQFRLHSIKPLLNKLSLTCRDEQTSVQGHIYYGSIAGIADIGM
jgi:hypothetical protein